MAAVAGSGWVYLKIFKRPLLAKHLAIQSFSGLLFGACFRQIVMKLMMILFE